MFSLMQYNGRNPVWYLVMNSEKDKDITCRRCGNCCHVDVAAYTTIEDVQRWEKEGHNDILDHVRDNDVEWSDDGFTNRFGSNIKTCLMSCVYLTWGGSLASCRIYETRTGVCRNYVPGSSDLCPQYNKAIRAEKSRIRD